MPARPRMQTPERERNLFSVVNPDAPYLIEARRLLGALFRRQKASEHKVYMVTSAARRDGKSTVCSVLGMVAATKFGKRTLIIDGDTRRPSLHRYLGLEPNLGFSDVLRGPVRWREAIQPTGHSLLFALSCGAAGPDDDVYQDEPFRKLLEEARNEFDLILVDSPPVLPVIEPVLMGEHVDGILLVIMAGKTRVALVNRMRKLLEPVSSKVVGCIMNDAKACLPYTYDYRYYSYPSRRRA